jgi:putative hydroxymethylpyrimidine transport system substrate-binding protein
MRYSLDVKRFSALVLLALMILTSSAAAPAHTGRAPIQHITLWLDWYPNSDHAGIYVALAKGFYAREGLSVSAQVPPGAADALKLLAHGNGDLAISYEPSVLLARAAGLPIVATAAIVQRPLNCIMSLAGSGITRPRQLEGHTVGIAGVPSDYTDIKAAVSGDGGDPSKVKTVVLNYALLQALLSRHVDAVEGVYWTWEALQAEQSGHKVNVMRLDHYGMPTYNELVMVSSAARIKQQAATLRAFQRATFDGYAYAIKHPAEATSILLKVKGVLSSSRGLIEQSIHLLSPTFTDAQGRFGTLSAVRWQRYADWMTAHKLLPHHIDAGAAITMQLMP